MNQDQRTAAETHLVEAATQHGFADPRPPYRDRLRSLKQTHRTAFDRAVAHYEEAVLPNLVTGDPLVCWIDYGRFLGSLTADGKVTFIDATGHARSPAGNEIANAIRSAESTPLVLFVPADNSADVLPLLVPAETSAAQRATISLLVDRKLALV